MTILRLLLLISLPAFNTMAQQPIGPPASCPVTHPPAEPFKPAGPYHLDENSNSFWLGTEKLGIILRKSGVWAWAPHAAGHENDVQPLTEKTFWISKDFNWRTEYPPGLKVTGRRLDGFAPPLLTLRSTNAFIGRAVTMLSGVYVPTPGCWEITGDYKSQKLSFVVWVKPMDK